MHLFIKKNHSQMYTILTIELNSSKTFCKNKLKRFYCFLKIFAKKKIHHIWPRSSHNISSSYWITYMYIPRYMLMVKHKCPHAILSLLIIFNFCLIIFTLYHIHVYPCSWSSGLFLNLIPLYFTFFHPSFLEKRFL